MGRPHELRDDRALGDGRSAEGGLSTIDTWDQGDPYERYIGRWSRRVAPLFLDWLRMPSGLRWLDVGCGTGSLCAAVLEHGAPASVIGVEPSDGFRATASSRLAGRATVLAGRADSIPLADDSVDATISGLVFNFVPDPRAALAEMARVTARGGTVAAYVWDYAGRMDLIRRFWDAVIELHPDATSFDEGVRFPACSPDALLESFAGAGLEEVEATALEIPTRFASFDDYWQPFLGGQGPAPAYVTSLDEAERVRLRERLRERLPIAADGSLSMIARAWAARGVVAAGTLRAIR